MQVPIQPEEEKDLPPSDTETHESLPTLPDRHASILLLGSTGTGKSSFIAETSGCNVQIGHGISSCTQECAAYEFTDRNTRITLIDTPGFDDTARNDIDTLTTIASYVGNAQLPPICGIIYFHRITDKRLTGTSRMNLEIMKAISGEAFYPHVILCTTMWGKSPDEVLDVECERRVKQLLKSPKLWGDLCDKGSEHMPFSSSRESGMRVVEYLINLPSPPPPTQLEADLQRETSIDDTHAGEIILGEQRRREQQKLQELQELQKELMEEQQQLASYVNRGQQMAQPRTQSSGWIPTENGKPHLIPTHGDSQQTANYRSPSPESDDTQIDMIQRVWTVVKGVCSAW